LKLPRSARDNEVRELRCRNERPEAGALASIKFSRCELLTMLFLC
jgi:hypothetical protein